MISPLFKAFCLVLLRTEYSGQFQERWNRRFSIWAQFCGKSSGNVYAYSLWKAEEKVTTKTQQLCSNLVTPILPFSLCVCSAGVHPHVCVCLGTHAVCSCPNHSELLIRFSHFIKSTLMRTPAHVKDTKQLLATSNPTETGCLHTL